MKYLEKKVHNPYRNASGIRVQVDAYVTFSNSTFRFNTVFTVVPLSDVPNCRSGVILGHHGFIDRLVYTQIPQAVLKRRGEHIKDDK